MIQKSYSLYRDCLVLWSAFYFATYWHIIYHIFIEFDKVHKAKLVTLTLYIKIYSTLLLYSFFNLHVTFFIVSQIFRLLSRCHIYTRISLYDKSRTWYRIPSPKYVNTSKSYWIILFLHILTCIPFNHDNWKNNYIKWSCLFPSRQLIVLIYIIPCW